MIYRIKSFETAARLGLPFIDITFPMKLVTRAARAIAVVDGDVLLLLYVEPDHDKAYP